MIGLYLIEGNILEFRILYVSRYGSDWKWSQAALWVLPVVLRVGMVINMMTPGTRLHLESPNVSRALGSTAECVDTSQPIQ